MRVLHGLEAAVAYFQSTIPPLFETFKNAMKTCIDDITIHIKTKGVLLGHRKMFFKICKKTQALSVSCLIGLLHKKTKSMQKNS